MHPDGLVVSSYQFAQEKEAVESYDEWCKTALKKLSEASPLSLKITLQSVSDLVCLHVVVNSVCFYTPCLDFLLCNQIREGRFQTLDQCLAREYRISLNGVTKRVSNDFCEVWDKPFLM